MIQIKHRYSGKILFEYRSKSILDAVKAAIKARANLSGADLSGADLSGANLSVANLSRADLSRANLSGADLSWADLSWADLSEADLSRADLLEADLSEADLSRANLSRANLSWADLSGADLSGANLSRADLDFSSGITFRCSSFGFKADIRLAAQLAYHFCRIDFGGCEEAKAARDTLKILANKFHRVEECGRIE